MTQSQTDIAALVAELRHMAQKNFYPFDTVRNEASTSREVIDGLVKLAEVPDVTKSLLRRAADALEALSQPPPT